MYVAISPGAECRTGVTRPESAEIRRPSNGLTARRMPRSRTGRGDATVTRRVCGRGTNGATEWDGKAGAGCRVQGAGHSTFRVSHLLLLFQFLQRLRPVV